MKNAYTPPQTETLETQRQPLMAGSGPESYSEDISSSKSVQMMWASKPSGVTAPSPWADGDNEAEGGEQ